MEAGVVYVWWERGNEGVEVGGVCGVGSVVATEAAVVWLRCDGGGEVCEGGGQDEEKPCLRIHL